MGSWSDGSSDRGSWAWLAPCAGGSRCSRGRGIGRILPARRPRIVAAEVPDVALEILAAVVAPAVRSVGERADDLRPRGRGARGVGVHIGHVDVETRLRTVGIAGRALPA